MLALVKIPWRVDQAKLIGDGNTTAVLSNKDDNFTLENNKWITLGDRSSINLTNINGVDGGAGDDYLKGDSKLKGVLFGGKPGQILKGEAGEDTIMGTFRDDTIDGGPGKDTLQTSKKFGVWFDVNKGAVNLSESDKFENIEVFKGSDRGDTFTSNKKGTKGLVFQGETEMML